MVSVMTSSSVVPLIRDSFLLSELPDYEFRYNSMATNVRDIRQRTKQALVFVRKLPGGLLNLKDPTVNPVEVHQVEIYFDVW